jgi:hypothetical protein
MDSIRRCACIALGTLVLIATAACQTATPAGTSSPSEQASHPVASESTAASASAAAGCLSPEVVAALDEIGDGNLDTDPPLDEVADALEAVPLEGAGADARDSLVTSLRATPPEETMIVTGFAFLRSQVALPEC